MQTEGFQTVTVAPLQHRWESLLLLLALAALVLFTGLYAWLFGQQDQGQQLQPWQVSAYVSLNPLEQGIYNQLLLAADEISWLQEENQSWPAIGELESMLLPPFHRDLSWQNSGTLRWSLESAPDADSALYLGTAGQLPGQSSFLLVFERQFAGPVAIQTVEIWQHADSLVSLPAASDHNNLIRQGWQELIPYRGSDERQRLAPN